MNKRWLTMVWMFIAAQSWAVAPVLSDLNIVDVTPSSATLVWQVDNPAASHSVRVFTDAGAVTEVTTDFEVTRSPLGGGDPLATAKLDKLAAEDLLRAQMASRGLARVRIDGLQPGTQYFVQAVSDVAGDTASLPAAGAAILQTPELNSFITRSQQLRLVFEHADPSGWLVVASAAGVDYGVSALVGDGTADNVAFVNLAQLFVDMDANYEPLGETAISFKILRGDEESLAPVLDVTFIDGFAVSAIYDLDIPDDSASLQMVAPAVLTYTEGDAVVLAWLDELPAGTTLSLFYDDDDSGRDGTEIVAGLDADADGSDDMYAWNTDTVADGIYYVYAEASNGRFSYAPAALAIDRAGLDGDADNMSDLWERLYFGNLGQDGSQDSDLDARLDVAEYADRTSPVQPDFLFAGLGDSGGRLNLLSWPLAPDPGMDSGELLLALGGAATEISRVDPATQLAVTTLYDPVNGVSGTTFPIQARGGYYVRLLSDVRQVFNGTVTTDPQAFSAGVNLFGFSSLPAGYSAFDLMADLGGASFVASVGSIDTDTGRFENAVYTGAGSPAGKDFVFEIGKAYLVNMRQAVSGFSP